MTATVHLGFAVGTGEPVEVPIYHLAVTGQTQQSGKTTTLEALVSRSGRVAIAFVTKRHEASFRGEHHALAPYFRERADWQFVAAVLEATMRERMRFERSWIMRACKGAKTLADVQRNIRRLMDKAKGLSADVYMTLDHYLDIVVPQIAGLGHEPLALVPGLNVMDLSPFTTELQALVIRSVIEWVYTHATDTLVIIPEAWEFIPQNRGSPVLLACEQLIRKGGAGGNFVWLDSQDIASVHKSVLRSCGVWLLGVQREVNEVKRALAHIPGKKPKATEIATLMRGQFFACFGNTVVKVYVQPAWMENDAAHDIAMGWVRLPPAPRWDVTTAEGAAAVSPEEAARLRADNETLKRENDDLRTRISALESRYSVTEPPPMAPPQMHDESFRPPPAAPVNGIDLDALYAAIRAKALADPGDARMLAVLRRVNEIEVTKEVERIRVDYNTQPGVLAALIAEGFFAEPVKPAAIKVELTRRGRAVHDANVSRDLGRLTEQGFLTKEAGGTYQAVPAMKVRIVEQA